MGAVIAATTAMALVACAAGCRGRHAAGATVRPSPATQKLPSTAPTTSAAGETKLFEDRSHGFSLRYPAKWSLRQDPENVFTADARANDETGPELSVAVPKLPPHVPGMVPLGAVQSGYVDDLKKRLKDVKVEQRATDDIPITGCQLRRFAATGRDKNGPRALDVLVLYKNDRLYIITAEAPASEADKERAAFQQAVTSWQWLGTSRTPAR